MKQKSLLLKKDCYEFPLTISHICRKVENSGLSVKNKGTLTNTWSSSWGYSCLQQLKVCRWIADYFHDLVSRWQQTFKWRGKHRAHHVRTCAHFSYEAFEGREDHTCENSHWSIHAAWAENKSLAKNLLKLKCTTEKTSFIAFLPSAQAENSYFKTSQKRINFSPLNFLAA